MKESIRAYGLENAVKFKGKANPNAVLGKILGQFPEARAKTKDVLKDITTLCNEINSWSFEKQQKELEKVSGLLQQKPKQRKTGLPPLQNLGKISKQVVLRFEPSPSGPLHIGHAYVLGLNAAYAKEYKGKLILRIADTNADNIYVPAYDLIPQDAQWLTENGVTELMIQSDRMEIYYAHALNSLERGITYICRCSAEEFRALITKKIACPCRKRHVDENIKHWHNMFSKYQEGDAVMRLKTDVADKNPALRDFPLFRINDTEHPRQGKKYRVWPLMNFAVSIDDHDTGVTHILRGKDHADNAKRQKLFFDLFKWQVPETIFVGKINFTDLNVSCSKTRPLIQDGTFEGWDDIRLPFLPALRRRGYQAEAFIKYALEVGVSLTDKSVSKEEFFKTINHFNKEVIEEKADRYFFISNPQKITVGKAPELTVNLDLHPDHRKGGRNFTTNKTFYVTDTEEFKDGHLYRFMDCLTFKFDKGKAVFHAREIGNDKPKIIEWLPEDIHNIKVDVRMPDNSIVKGLGEPLLADLEEGDMVMFVRFGFCRFDKLEDDVYKFWFTHK
ncbi:glutamate--tRNA ligase [Candidatus Woesearchaeota archaeon]|nr:glutamate--tRNA ligase [Candidatus Woesearchaeota archaeon]